MEREFHSVLPLGSDIFLLDGFKGSIMLMATALTPELDGWKWVSEGGSMFLYAGDGSRAREYPRQAQFRVTASASDHGLANDDLLTVKSDLPLNEYLLSLRFQIKIFHGLQVHILEPSDVHMVGVPDDVPYRERIYRVTFQLPQVPVQDRLVLEVLSPDGIRLARFHYELM